MSPHKQIGKRKLGILIFVVMSLFSQSIFSQETETTYRPSIEVSKKIGKRFQVEFIPEFRFDESFAIDEFHLNGELKYKIYKGFSLSTAYRLITNYRVAKTTEYLSRYEFNARYEAEIARFEPSVRLTYTNYSDDDSGGAFLRYKFETSYDIKGLKITPELGYEGFYSLEDSEMFKNRFIVGAKYKLNKKNAIFLNYKFDSYSQENKRRNIFELGLKYKL